MRAPACVGMRLEEVETPALVLELDAFERNLATMARAAARGGVRLRPHAKTHKCPTIAARQLAAGAIGVCGQTVAEVEAMVEGGARDVMLTNEVVGGRKIELLCALAARARIGVCADDAANLRALQAAARAAGAALDVYVEIDVGAQRCGVAPGEPALALAREVAGRAPLRFAGLQAYHGPAQHLRAVAERRAAIARAAQAARETRALIESAGIACPVVTGAGTGSFPCEIESGAYDEIQPGSYVFMDADYAKNEAAAGEPRFEHALFVLGTVISRPTPRRAVLDAGLKASSVDSGLPRPWERPGLRYARASDEHGVLEAGPGAEAPAPGDKLLLVPGHCDPTVNLYDCYVCVRGGTVEALWPVTARGA
jgi:D-serine deaminase-like pyridoxal phosphate-dependent protein